jgi:hypothetical protein
MYVAKAPPRSHIEAMAEFDLRSQATFEIMSREDGSYAIVVQIPEATPVTVTSFLTSADADRWIARYKRRVAEEPPRKKGRPRQGSGPGRTPEG